MQYQFKTPDQLEMEDSCTLTDAEAYALLQAIFGDRLSAALKPVTERLRQSGMEISRAASNAATNAPVGSFGGYACQSIRHLNLR